MKLYLTIVAIINVTIVGVLLLTMDSAAVEQNALDPCPGSFAIYVDDQFVECMNAEQRYKAYP